MLVRSAYPKVTLSPKVPRVRPKSPRPGNSESRQALKEKRRELNDTMRQTRNELRGQPVSRSDFRRILKNVRTQVRQAQKDGKVDVSRIIADAKKQIGAARTGHAKHIAHTKRKMSARRSPRQDEFAVLQAKVGQVHRQLRDLVAKVRKSYSRPVVDPRGP